MAEGPNQRGAGAKAVPGEALDDRVFWACAALALAVHAVLLLRMDGLEAGHDMPPHLKLIDLMRAEPAIRSIYPPGYHALGALFGPVVGLAAYPQLFAFASAAALVLAFRFFARGAGLPLASAAMFALHPYALSATGCIPKVEFMGNAVGLLGLGFLVRGHYLAVALSVVGAFFVHTASGLVYGLAAGAYALGGRDWRALVALASGSLLVLPLFLAHLEAGCSLAEAFQFSESAYLQDLPVIPEAWPVVLVLASPVALVAALLGAGAVWRHSRPLAALCIALLLLYLNPVWLALAGSSTSADLQRGLSVLAIPVGIAAGLGVGDRRKVVLAVLAVCALWYCAAAFTALPASCTVRAVEATEVRGMKVRRCVWAWSNPQYRRSLKQQRFAP